MTKERPVGTGAGLVLRRNRAKLVTGVGASLLSASGRNNRGTVLGCRSTPLETKGKLIMTEPDSSHEALQGRKNDRIYHYRPAPVQMK